jgi:hypothetical protein
MHPKKKIDRKRTVRIKEGVQKMRERFRRHGDRSVRRMAKDLDVSRTSFRFS